ncbi:MAG: hypothetical protein KDA78_21230, partial [Planctomycetaceae bacterium]|nr:hypothetical protein [Planctomycetaceae bacterium]
VYPLHSEQLVPLMRFPLESVDTEPLLHESIVPDLPVGEYRLRLNIPDFPLGSEAIETELFVTQRKNGETNRLTADRRLLDRFAATTKGAVFLPHELDQLLARLSPESLVTETKADIPLWNHWLMFVMIMAILSVEWLVRKWHGLP